MCAVAGVAGPILAVVHGAATVFGLDEAATDELNAAARTEVRRVAQRITAECGDSAEDVRALEIALTWCATPIVPTYSVGVHLVLADLDEASSEVASDLAWVFRLACRRAQIDIEKDTPMLATACQALIETGSLTESMLREGIKAAGDSAAAAPAITVGGMERAVSAGSDVSSAELSFSRGVSPFVGNMLDQMEAEGAQPCSSTLAFTWARQCSEEMKGMKVGPGALRRQISPYIFNPGVKPAKAAAPMEHPPTVMEAKEEPSE